MTTHRTHAQSTSKSVGLSRKGVRRFMFAAAVTISLASLAGSAFGAGAGGLQGPQVTAGAASIMQAGKATSITAADKTIINWRGFNISVDELVRFIQPGPNAVVLNRVTGADPSSILGQLIANGRVFLVNPNGVVFGPNSKVDVGSLIASTFAIKDNDFLNGKYNFLQDASKDLSYVINKGEIKVAKNGFVFLVAPGVKNEGLIIAEIGKVALGSGTQLTVDFNGDGLITYAISGKVLNTVKGPDGKLLSSAVSNTGKISAPGGAVTLTGDAAKEVVSSVVNNEGIIEAKSLLSSGSSVKLVGGEGIVQNKGTIDVSAGEIGARGGRVEVSGEYAGNFGTIAARGSNGGRGGDVAISSTTQSLLATGGVIDVSGVGNSDGGSVRILSDTNTTAAGTILAQGGELGGNGGFVELSSKGGIDFTGTVSALAPNGQPGTLLIDPKNLIVQGGGVPFTGNAQTAFTATPTIDVTIDPANINTAGATVILQANNDLTVSSPIAMTAPGAGLTLQAGRTVQIGANITTTNGPISVTANDSTAIGANRTAGSPGDLFLSSPTTLNAGTSSITLTMNVNSVAPFSPGNITVSNLTASGGITINANGVGVTTPGPVNVTVTGGITSSAATGGNVTINGANNIQFQNAVIFPIDARGTAGNGGTVTLNGAGMTYTGNPSNGIDTRSTGGGGNGGNITINLTADYTQPSGNQLLSAGNGGGTGGNISITSQTISIGSVINSGNGSITLAPAAFFSASVGNGAANTFDVNTTELGLLQTTTRVTIGGNNANTLAVTSAIVSPAPTLILASGGSITQSGAGAVTATNLGVIAAGNVALATNVNTVGTLAASVTGPGQIFSFSNGANTLTVGTVTANSGNIVGITTNNGAITLIADDMDIQQAVSAGTGRVTLDVFTNNRSVDLGTNTGGTLGLTDAELDRVTAGVLQIGGSAQTGPMSITLAITAPAGYSTLSLVNNNANNGDITDMGFAGPGIAVTNLRVSSNGLVGMWGNFDVTTLAASIGNGNDFFFRDVSGGFQVATVDGVAGITTTGNVQFNAIIGPVTQAASAPISANNVEFEGANTGSITLNSPTNNVTTLSANVSTAANGFTFVNGGTLIVGTGPDGTVGVTTNAGPINISTVNGGLTINQAVNAGANSVSLTAGTASAAGTASLLDIQAGVTGGGVGTGVTLIGNNININATVNGGANQVSIRQFTNGTLINIGGADVDGNPDTLGLTAAEINNVTAASSITIGNLNSGSVSVTTNLTPTGTGALRIFSGGSISNSAAGNGIVVAALDLHGASVDFSTSTFSDVTLLAGASTGAGGVFNFRDNGGGLSTTAFFDNGITTNAGAVNIVAAGGGLLTVTVGSAITTGTGANITLTANTMSIAAAVNAGAQRVTLQPFTAATTIDIGAAGAGTLVLTNASIGFVTAGTLQIGNATSGTITVVNNTSTTASTLDLETGNDIVRTTGTVTVNGGAGSLALRAVNGIGSGGAILTAAANLALINTTANAVQVSNTGALSIGTVDGLSGATQGANALLQIFSFAGVSVTPGNEVVGAGNVTLEARGDANSLSVQANVRTTNANGIVALLSEGNISITNGTVGTTAGAVTNETVLLFADSNANGSGTITINAPGQVRAANLGLTSGSGIGTVGSPLQTAVNRIEAQTATGGIFISNTGSLIVGGVTAALNGVRVTTSGDIAITTTANLSLDTAGDNIQTVNGNITLTTGAGGIFTLNPTTNPGVSASGSIIINADDMVLSNTIVSSTTVTLRQAGATARAIDLGSNNNLGLTDAELDLVTAPSGLTVGRSNNTGAIVISAAITQPAGYSTLNLISGGTITETAGNLQVTTVTTNSVGGTTLNTAGNAISNFSATNTTAGNISLTNNTAATLTINTISETGGGTVTVNNTGNITLSNNNPAISTDGGSVSLQATTGNITSAVVDATGDVNTSGQLNVTTVTSGNIGTATTFGNELLVTVGTLNATAAGGGFINVRDTGGGLTVAGATTTNGNISIRTTGNLIINDNAVNAGNALVQLTATTGNITSANINGTADVTTTGTVLLTTLTSGNIGSAASGAGNALEIDGVTLGALAQGAGFINVLDTAGGLFVFAATTTVAGTIEIRTTGNLVINDAAVSTGNGNITLQATTGDITSVTINNVADVTTTGTVILRTVTSGNIGTTNAAGGELEINSGALDAATAGGGFINVLQTVGTLTVANASSGGGVVRLRTLSGNVIINDGAVQAGAGDVFITANNGNITSSTRNGVGDVVSSGTITLATTGTGGTIGTAALGNGNELELGGSPALTATTANNGFINVRAPAGDLSLNLLDAGTGTVRVRVDNGEIRDNNAGGNNITGTSAMLIASGPIGTNGGAGGVFLETQVSNIQITNNNVGGVEITNTGNLTFADLESLGYGAQNTARGINVNATGSISTAVNVTAASNLRLNAGTSISQTAGTIQAGFVITLIAGTTITQSGTGQLFANGLIVQAVGSVNLPTTTNSVSNLAAAVTGAGSTFTYVNAGSLNINDVTTNNFGTQSGITTNNGAINVSTVNGNLTVIDTNSNPDVSSTGGTITLTAGGTNNLFTNDANANIVSGGNTITITADRMTLNAGSVIDSGAATTILRNLTAGRPISLGGTNDASANLELSSAEIDTVTAGILEIGRNDASAAGNITIDANIAPAGTSTLSLVTTGSITRSGNFTITETNLAMNAGTGIGSNVTPILTAVSNLEAQTDTGGIFVTNTGALTIGGVLNTLTGVHVTTSGDVAIVASGTISLSDTDAGTPIVTSGSNAGNVSLTANGATSDVVDTVNNDAISAPRGSITVIAGRDILFGVGANFDNDVRASNGIIFQAGRDITIDGFADVAANDFGQATGGGVVFTAGRNINVTQAFGTSASVGVSAGTGTIVMTTGADSTLTITSPADSVFTQGGDITLNADRVVLGAGSGTNAGAGIVTIQQVTAGRLIDLGSTTDAGANTLELSNAELGTITTSSVLRIGNAVSGNISLTAAISAPATWGTLHLQTGGAVNDPGGFTLTIATAPGSLAIEAVNGIGSGANGPLFTAVSNLATNNTTAGSTVITNTAPTAAGLTIPFAGVDGVFGQTNSGGGNITVVEASPIVIDAAIVDNNGGSISYTANGADGTITMTPTGSITANGGSGSITLIANGVDGSGNTIHIMDNPNAAIDIQAAGTGMILLQANAGTGTIVVDPNTVIQSGTTDPNTGGPITIFAPNSTSTPAILIGDNVQILTNGNIVINAPMGTVSQSPSSFTGAPGGGPANTITITAFGDVILGSNSAAVRITVTSTTGNITDDLDKTTFLQAPNITLNLNAANGNTRSIGTIATGAGGAITGSDVIQGTGNYLSAIDVNLQGGTLTINMPEMTNPGNIQVRQVNGPFLLTGLNLNGSNPGANLVINTANGVNFLANQIAFIANGGFIGGTNGGPLVVTGTIDVSTLNVDLLLASKSSGGFTNSLNILGGASVINTNANVRRITLLASSPMFIGGTVTGGTVVAASTGDGVGDGVFISGLVQSTNSTVTLEANADIGLTGSAIVRTTTTGTTITIASDVDATFDAVNLFGTASNGAGSVSMSSGSSVTSANNATIGIQAGLSSAFAPASSQDVQVSTVSAGTGTVNITAFNGAIIDGNAANVLNVTGGTVNLVARRGATAFVTNIDLDVNASTSITASSNTGGGNGNISLRSTGANNLPVGAITAGTGTVTLSAGVAGGSGGITDTNGAGVVNITAGNVNLTSTSATGITTEVNATGTITANSSTGNGPISIANVGGAGLTIGTTNSGTNTILFDGNDGTVTVTGNVTSTNAGTAIRFIDGSTFTQTLGTISAAAGTITIGEGGAGTGDQFTGTITQTGGNIGAGTLTFSGRSTVTLNRATNDFGTITGISNNGAGAGGVITINDVNTLTVGAAGVSSAGANNITITTGGTLTLTGAVTSGATTTLTATSGNVTSTTSGDATAEAVGTTINLNTSGGTITVDIDQQGGAGALNAGSAGGAITIRDVAGGVRIGDGSTLTGGVKAGTGNVSITAVGGNIVSTVIDGTADIVGNLVTLTTTGAGNLGTTQNTPNAELEINAGTLVATTAGGFINIRDTAGGLIVTTASATAAGDVRLRVSNGDLTTADATTRITGTNIFLSTDGATVGSIGTSAIAVGIAGTSLSADTSGGLINIIDNAGGLNVTNARTTNGGSTGANISIATTDAAAANLTVAENAIQAGVGNVSLTATRGNITSAVEGQADVTGNGVTLTTLISGNVGPIEVSATTLNVSSVGSINVTTTTSVNIPSATSAAGGLTISTTGDMTIGLLTAIGQTVTLTATGAIIDGNAALNNINATSAALSAGTNIGASSDILETSVANLEARSLTGSIFIANTGTVTIGGVTGALNGINANGGAATTAQLSSTGSILMTADAADNIAAPNVVLTAATGIGTVALPIRTNTSNLTATNTAGDINIVNTAAAVNILSATTTGNVTITNTTGAMTISTITATGGTATLTATGAGGAIIDGNGAATNITDTTAVLRAAGGIGTAADPIETVVSSLSAIAGSGGVGGVFINNTGNVGFGVVTSAGGANIVINNAGNILVAEGSVSAGPGNVTLTANGGNITGPATNNSADVTGATITLLTTGTGNTIGTGGAPLEVNATTQLNAQTQNGNIFMTDTTGGVVVGLISAGTANVTLTALGSSITSTSPSNGVADIIGARITLTAGTTIGTNAGSTLDIDAGTGTGAAAGLNATAGGNMFITDVAGGVTIGSIIAGGGGANVNLTALNGNITSATIDNTADITAATLTLITTGTGSIGTDTTTATALETNAITLNATTAGGVINVNDFGGGLAVTGATTGGVAGNITIQTFGGTLAISAAAITSSGGNVKLTNTAGGITIGQGGVNAGTGSVTLTAATAGATGITSTINGVADVIGSSVTATTTTSGSITLETSTLFLTVNSAAAITVNNLTVGGNDLVVLAANSGGNNAIAITQNSTTGGGDLLVAGGAINAGTGTVNLTANNGGSIISTNSDGVADVTGSIITLVATTQGAFVGTIGTANAPLDIAGSSLSATAASGVINVDDIGGGLTLTNATTTTAPITISTTGGALTVTGNVTTTGAGNISLTGIGYTQTGGIVGGNPIVGYTGAITIDAGGDTFLLTTGTIQTSNATAAAIRLIHGTTATVATTALAVISAPNGTLTIGEGATAGTVNSFTGDVTVHGLLTINTLTVNSGGAITIGAVGGVGPITCFDVLGPVIRGGAVAIVDSGTIIGAPGLLANGPIILGNAATPVSITTTDGRLVLNGSITTTGANDITLTGVGITQTAGTISATAATVTLTAGAGDITQTGGNILALNLVGTAGTTVTLTQGSNDFGTAAIAANGAVSLQDVNGLIVGTVNGVVGITSGGGSAAADITIVTGGGLVINAPINAGIGTTPTIGADVTITVATGTITDGTAGALPVIIGDTVTLTTTNGNIGTITGVTASDVTGTAVKINANVLNGSTAGGTVLLIDTADGVAIGLFNAGTGSFKLTATGGSITDADGVAGTTDLVGALIVLTVTGGVNSNIGTLGVPTAPTAAGALKIDGTALTVTTDGGNVSIIDTFNGIAINTLNAVAGNIFLTAQGGAITDNNGATNNLVATNVGFVATSGIGTAGDPIESTIAAFEAVGGTGGVFLTNTGNLTLGGVATSVHGTAMGGVSASGSDIVISAIGVGSNLTINELVNNTAAIAGNITLTAANNINQNANVTAATNGNVTLTAGTGSITMSATPGISTTSTTGNVTYTAAVNEAINIITTGGNVTITATAGAITDVNGPAVNVTANILTMTAATGIGTVADPFDTTVTSITATTTGVGPIVINETNAVTLTAITAANGLITVTAGGTITATSVVSTTDADANDISLTATGGGSILLGTITIGPVAGNAVGQLVGTGTFNPGGAGGTLDPLSGVRSFGSGDVTLTANTGAAVVTMNPGGRITADVLTINAVVGTSAGIGTATDPIVTTVNRIIANTATGGISIAETDAVRLTLLTAGTGNIIVTNGRTAPSGVFGVTVGIADHMIVDTVATGAGGVSLTTTGSIIPVSPPTGGAFNVSATGNSILVAGFGTIPSGSVVNGGTIGLTDFNINLDGVFDTCAPLLVNIFPATLTVTASGTSSLFVSVCINGIVLPSNLLIIQPGLLGVAPPGLVLFNNRIMGGFPLTTVITEVQALLNPDIATGRRGFDAIFNDLLHMVFGVDFFEPDIYYYVDGQPDNRTKKRKLYNN